MHGLGGNIIMQALATRKEFQDALADGNVHLAENISRANLDLPLSWLMAGMGTV